MIVGFDSLLSQLFTLTVTSHSCVTMISRTFTGNFLILLATLDLLLATISIEAGIIPASLLNQPISTLCLLDK